MALTREFKETVVARARSDAKFRDAMFAEAINAYLAGDTQTGKAMLRDLVNATIGFEGLSAEIRKPSKSLHRMLAARGNPSTENFFGIVKALQKDGWTIVRQRGSHIRLQKRIADELLKITVPAHRPVKRSTLAHILKQVRVTVTRFTELL